MKHLALAGAAVVLLSGCGDGGEQYQKEAEGLRSEVQQLHSRLVASESRIKALESENAVLKESPHVLLAAVREFVDKKQETEARSAVDAMARRYPDAIETATARKLFSAMVSEREAKEKEAARLVALGFKGLPVKAAFTGESSSVNLSSAKIGGVWKFNDHDDEYEYRNPERGAQYVTAQVTYSSSQKDPDLLAMAVYSARDGRLKRLGTMKFELVKWESYATFLGNYHDSGNDFAHSEKVRFSMGLQIQNEELVKPVYIVASRKGCASRIADRFGNPPVKYSISSCNTLPSELTLGDFEGNEYGILKRFD